MTGFTKGDWYFTDDDDNSSAIKSDQGGRVVYVADVLNPCDRPLIAAAPDMYEALCLIDAYLYATAPESNERKIVLAALYKSIGE